MPTIDEWVQGLVADRKVKVVSSNDLVNKIHEKQNVRILEANRQKKPIPQMKSPVTTVPIFAPHKDITIKPLSLLHSIGVTTTPPIQNLADLSSTWAIIRYIWAFALPTPKQNQLRLSDVASDIDFHQKALLSDEVGVGMASYIMANFLGTPNSIDVSLALDDPCWSVQQQYGASPDYIFFDNSRSIIKIVECKGNQTSKALAMDQIRRGTEQLPSIIFNAMPAPDSYVVATHLTSNSVTVYIVDPPGEEKKVSDLKNVERASAREWQVNSDDLFVKEMTELHHAKILSFAGDDEAAQKKVGDKLESKRNKSTRVMKPESHQPTDRGKYVGIRQILPISDDVTIEAFKGLNEELRHLIVDSTAEKAFEFTNKFEMGSKDQGGSDYYTTELEREGSKIFQSFSSNGTMFEISVRPKMKV
ncbi:MAG: hypothetical protein PHF56_23920 [Desulfuromonadaceae bacterium]|nr:hypothetical protein [Desulfuromonadaceae bacterium]